MSRLIEYNYVTVKGGGHLQESRLFRILYYLLDKGRATAPELAEKFEVSVRTIYRDVDTISSAGIPIYVTTGRNGGIQFLDSYVLDKSFFSDKEKQEMLSSIQSLSAVQYPEIDSVLKKLGAIFQVSHTDWIEVDFSRWGSIAENENQLFHQLRQSIFERCKISFDYYNSSGKDGKREALPRKLVYKDKAWYLNAFCTMHNAYRLFRFSRIKNLTLTDEHFEKVPDTEQAVFPKPQDIGNLIDLELRFPLEVGYRLYDILEDSSILKNENGYTVNLSIPENDWLYDFLMSFGEKITIIRPQFIKQRIIEKHIAALKHYEEIET